MPRILAKTKARRRVKRAPLEEYIRKRDFTKTAEPAGKIASTPSYGRFVIQKHAASHLHYDFRLEIAGTLKSWAVPKGLPYTKGEKRLAVQVEDHPVSYIDFEGVIPQGQYGGGTVMVWDQGTFETVSPSPTDELAAGKLHFVLHGKKLEGEWYLVRLRDEKQWLLIKGKEDMRPVSARMDDTSAASGKTMKQLGAGGEVWSSNRAQPKPRPVRRKRTLQASAPLAFVEPMKARLTARPPAGDWLYEIKFDGFRALALKNGGDIGLWSRNEKDFKGKFPEVARSVADLKVGSAIIDGEIVALDPQGRSYLHILQPYDMGEKRPPNFF